MSAANDREREPTAAELDLMAYLDGELEPERVAEVEAKLASDTAYAGVLRGLEATFDFVHDDADRLYSAANVDGIADLVMNRIERERQSALPPSAIPLSSVQTRRQKNTVIWVVFGSVAAAAAGLLFYVRSQDSTGTQAINTPSVPAETVAAKTNLPAPETTKPPAPKAVPLGVPASVAEVEDLEIGEGASVIYTTSSAGETAPVVWITPTSSTKK